MSRSNLPPTGDTAVVSLSDDDDRGYDGKAEHSAAAASLQPQQFTMTTAEPSFVGGSSSGSGGMQYSWQVVMSCFVIWCCGPGCFCGVAALVLAGKWNWLYCRYLASFNCDGCTVQTHCECNREPDIVSK